MLLIYPSTSRLEIVTTGCQSPSFGVLPARTGMAMERASEPLCHSKERELLKRKNKKIKPDITAH